MDAPQTPGDWSLRVNQNETLALYGLPETEPVFYMRCERPSLRVTLALAGEEPDGDAAEAGVVEAHEGILEVLYPAEPAWDATHARGLPAC